MSDANEPTYPLVTIGIPTYNRADDTLPKALASALAQTYPNLEIVISDNCSDDNTAEIVAGFNDPRIRYIRHDENIGANNNFNACVEHAKGTYLLLLHDDDFIEPELVASCMQRTDGQTDIGIIISGMRAIDGEGQTLWEKHCKVDGAEFIDLIDAWFANQATMFCCNTLIHTQTLREADSFGSKHDLFQDVLAHIKVAAKKGFRVAPGIHACFRDHDNSRGAVARITAWCEDSSDLLQTIAELAPLEHRERITQTGLRFFCRMNYSYVAALPGIRGKLSAYREVAGHFHSAEPMWPYIWQKDLRPAIRRLLKRQ